MKLKTNFSIEQLGKIKPSKDFKIQARQRLMQRIQNNQENPLETLLRTLQSLKVSESFHLAAKERLFYQMNQKNFWEDFFRSFLFNKKLISISTSFAILFVSISLFVMQMPQTVEASNEVRLLILEGNPQVKSLGEEWQEAEQMQIMRIGDKIMTDHNDIVEILFFNNSVTRLDYNTEITINTFSKKQETEEVALELEGGRAWNKVMKAFSDVSDFSVKTHNSLVSAQNATFDVAVQKDQPTKIMVVDHLIDVKILESNTDSVVAKTKVTEGYAVEVQISDEKTMAQAAQITPLEDNSQETNEWMTNNLTKDENHLKQLEEQYTENIVASAGILPTSPLYKVKTTLQNAKEIIAKTDEQELSLEKIKQKFQEAAALKTQSENEKSQIALGEFQALFLEVASNSELNYDLNALLASLQENYITISPESNLYEFKDVLENLQIEITDQPDFLTNKRKTKKLLEAQDLIEKGSIALAQELLVSIQDLEILPLTEDDVLTEENVDKKAVLLQKTEELQILKSMRDKIQTEESGQIMDVLNLIQQETVAEIAELAPPPVEIAAPKPPAIVIVDKELEKQQAVTEFLSKIYLYKSERGQLNSLHSLLKKTPNHKSQIPILVEVRKQLPLEQQHFVTQKILEITKQ